MNSFETVEPLYKLANNTFYFISLEKTSVELKLPEPYNPCKEYSFGDKPFHQMNCIEECVYKEIKNKDGCTFLGTLFAIEGFQNCYDLSSKTYTNYKDECWEGCKKECPLESCYSERFTSLMRTNYEEGLTEFWFNLRDFSSLNITQIAKTDLWTFINNIGGGFGLSMGLALPNFVEFFQFIVDILLTTIFQ